MSSAGTAYSRALTLGKCAPNAPLMITRDAQSGGENVLRVGDAVAVAMGGHQKAGSDLWLSQGRYDRLSASERATLVRYKLTPRIIRTVTVRHEVAAEEGV